MFTFTDIDECVGNECVHGSCVDRVNEYSCDCQPGYTGTHCETSESNLMLPIFLSSGIKWCCLLNVVSMSVYQRCFSTSIQYCLLIC